MKGSTGVPSIHQRLKLEATVRLSQNVAHCTGPIWTFVRADIRKSEHVSSSKISAFLTTEVRAVTLGLFECNYFAIQGWLVQFLYLCMFGCKMIYVSQVKVFQVPSGNYQVITGQLFQIQTISKKAHASLCLNILAQLSSQYSTVLLEIVSLSVS